MNLFVQAKTLEEPVDSCRILVRELYRIRPSDAAGYNFTIVNVATPCRQKILFAGNASKICLACSGKT
jgi:hypothetical protein